MLYDEDDIEALSALLLYIIVLKLTPRLFRTNKTPIPKTDFRSFIMLSTRLIRLLLLHCRSVRVRRQMYNVHNLFDDNNNITVCPVFAFYVIFFFSYTPAELDLNEFSAVMNPWQWVRVTRDLCRRLASFVNATTCTSHGRCKVV